LRVLHLLSNFEHRGAGQQVAWQAQELCRRGHTVHACALARVGPVADNLSAAGAEVHALGWGRAIDPAPWLQLRRLLKQKLPDIVHVWGNACVMAMWGIPRSTFGKLVASPTVPAKGSSVRKRLDGWLLAKADLVFAASHYAKRYFDQIGVGQNRIHLVFPCVGLDGEGSQTFISQPTRSAKLPEGRGYVVSVGPFADYLALRDTVWAFDILRYRYADVDLLLVGEGPAMARIRQFVHDVQCSERVHFAGETSVLGPFLKRSTSIWVSRRNWGGTQAVLQGMVAGRPVVASAIPELRELITDRSTGLLVPPGDVVGFAKQTRLLLNEPALAQAIGESGQRWAMENASAPKRMDQVLQLYEQTPLLRAS
jgi:glycosyltransferase involved in cell wall biosynthesis